MNKHLILLLIPLLLLSCDFSLKPEDTRIAHRLLKKTAIEINRKFNLKNYSITESGNSGEYKLLGMSFIKNGAISKSEARKLIIDCTQILLNNINSEEKFQKYLSSRPFTEKNIELSILIYGENQERLYRPNNASITLVNGSIYFRYNIPNEKYKMETETETYKEALEIIKKENIQ